MLEIFILVATLFLAKRSPRRRFTLRRVRVTPERALSTLASDTVIANAFVANATSPYRAMSIKATWSIIGLTVGEGPITVGIAHSDYTVAEIKEALEAATSINPALKVEAEQGNRLVRIVGTISQGQQQLNNGNPIKTRLNWLMGVGAAPVMFAYNEFPAALTTGAVVHAQGDLWVKDSA